MSPQSRATISDNTTFASRDDGWSCNSCSGTSSVADLARAANMEYALHKIESESSSTPANPLMCQTGNENPSRKRSSAHISSSPKNQPFLSSYGSAFLSGIFADIAQASDEDQPAEAIVASVHAETADTSSSEQCIKKARTTASTSFRSQSKSYVALVGLSEGAISEVQSPSVVSPRFNMTKNQVLNDQVRELQDMAFPSLPQIPITVSSSSCSTSSGENSSPRPSVDEEGVNRDEQDSPAYGWFVSTDDDVAVPMDQSVSSSASMFLPDTKPDLAFKAPAAPSEGNHDLVVQQALAADTIDDVLGDLF